MTASSFDQAGEARAALRAIVADPDHGPSALSDPTALSNLLADYLPDAPRETEVLLAAARADVAGMLQGHIAEGMDPPTAIRIAASSLEARTAYSSQAAAWVTGEVALALGLTGSDQLHQPTTPGQGTDLADRGVPAAAGVTLSATLPGTARRSAASVGHQPAARKAGTRRLYLAAVSIVVLAAAAYGGIALARGVSGQHPTAGGRPSASREHHPTDTNGATPGTSVPPPDSGQWTSATLTITPTSLGAVTIGMTLAQASAAAGEQLTEVGDGLAYPGGNSSSGLFVAGLPVTAVVASVSGFGPTVVTAQGFQLGGTVARLKAIYGTSLVFVPKPATGYNPVPGYVVAYPNGNLAFIVDRGVVTAICAGPGVRPSYC